MALTCYQKRKKKSGKCITPYCRNLYKRGNYCYKCRHRRLKERDPVRYAYYSLRSNAKRRGKEFTLTLGEFRKFAAKVDLLYYRGIKMDSYHIDRKQEDEGYHAGNIQLLQNHENVKKYHAYRRIHIEKRTGENYENLPF